MNELTQLLAQNPNVLARALRRDQGPSVVWLMENLPTQRTVIPDALAQLDQLGLSPEEVRLRLVPDAQVLFDQIRSIDNELLPFELDRWITLLWSGDKSPTSGEPGLVVPDDAEESRHWVFFRDKTSAKRVRLRQGQAVEEPEPKCPEYDESGEFPCPKSTRCDGDCIPAQLKDPHGPGPSMGCKCPD